MSALDKAFVKAYGKVAHAGRSVDTQVTAPVVQKPLVVESARAPLPETAPLPNVPKVQASERGPARESLVGTSTKPNQSLTTSATSAEVAAPSSPIPEILYRPEWISPSQTNVIPAPHFDLRLTSFTSVSAAPVTTRIDPPHEIATAPLQAAYEVETFTWPDIVQQLGDLSDEAFGQLLGELGELSGRGQKLIAISGCQPESGATTLLLALAQRLAKREVSTVIVDLEFWQPRLATQLGIAPQVGWWEVLKGTQPLTEALVESLNDHVTMMPLCEAIPADRLTNTAQLTNLLRTLSKSFDLVLLNAGPLKTETSKANATDVAFWLGKLQVDLTLLVRDSRTTTHDQALAFGNRLTAAGAKRWHLAENYVSADAPIEEPTRAAEPIAPVRTASAPVSTYSAPVTTPSMIAQTARPAAASSAAIPQGPAGADWQSTVVPPWKA